MTKEKRYKDRGAIESKQLADGVTIRVRHEGRALVKRWQYRVQAAQLNDAKRVRAMVAEYGEDVLSDVYAEVQEVQERLRQQAVAEFEEEGKDVPERLAEPVSLQRAMLGNTPEARRANDEIITDIVRECIVSLDVEGRVLERGEAGGDEGVIDEAVDELARLGLIDAAANFAQEVQRVSAPDFPVAAGDGDAGRGGPASGDGGDRAP